MPTLTMQQIAHDLGLSRMTVSKIVNGRARLENVSPGIEHRVRQYMDEIGYVRSRHALALRTGRRGAYGILHCGGLFSHLIDAFNLMGDRFVASPWSVEILVVKPQAIVEGLRELIGRGVSNVIWIYGTSHGGELSRIEPALRLLANVRTVIYNYPFPAAAWDQRLSSAGIYMVGVDRQKGFAKLGRMLKQLGHRRAGIPFLSPAEVESRESYVARGLLDAGLEVIGCRPAKVPPKPPGHWGQALAGPTLQAMRQHLFTVACMGDDELAAQTIRGLIDLGVRVPEDLSVTGMDGTTWASAMRPSVTTLRIPTGLMVDCVQNILSGGNANLMHKFPLDLIEAESHGPVRPGKPEARREPAPPGKA